MALTKKEVKERLARFESTCKKAGIKVTHQRHEIYKEAASTEDHPDAESIYKGVRVRIPEISLDTVYRTLWLLHDLGLIAALGSSSERVRFDANIGKHHHYVCKQCGLTRDFYSDALNELQIPESVELFGKVDETQIEVRGICKACSKKK